MISRLDELGVREIVADTDVPNTPMAAAFATVGFPQMQTRTDVVHRR